MRFLDGKSIGALGLVLALGITTAGCGDDDSSPGDAGPDGSVDGGGAGNNGGGGNSGGAGKDSGTDSGTTTGGTGGRPAGGTGGGGALPMAPTCDSSIDKTATCGGTACAASTSMFAQFVCSVPCCLPDDSCGYRRAIMDNVTDCAPLATEDPSCPAYMGMGVGGMGMMMSDAGADAGADGGAGQFPGCCAPSGKCGIISSIDMTCITSSQLLADLKPGAACGGGNDGGANDAGN